MVWKLRWTRILGVMKRERTRPRVVDWGRSMLAARKRVDCILFVVVS